LPEVGRFWLIGTLILRRLLNVILGPPATVILGLSTVILRPPATVILGLSTVILGPPATVILRLPSLSSSGSPHCHPPA